jgi:bifunctional non-homologous end joining protein LigD
VQLVPTEHLFGCRRAAFPAFIAPQLAVLVKEPPAGDDWLHELNYDGYRMLCHINGDKARFWSRNGKRVQQQVPVESLFALEDPV